MLGGMLLGSVVTMLVTPQSGPELRNEIEKARCRCDEAVDKL